MQQKKLVELQNMLHLMKGTCCIRAQLVSYFEQNFVGQVNCCSDCGHAFNSLLLKRDRNKEKRAENWQSRLRLLLKISG